MVSPPPRRPRRSLALRILLIVAALIALLVLIWDWNWFKPIVESRASAAAGRKVTLTHFDVQLSWHPLLVADGIVVANPDGYDEPGEMARADHIAVRVDLRRLLHRHVKLDELIIQHPTAELRRSASGQVNWQMAPSANNEDPAAAAEIASLKISDGLVHLLDPKVLKADMSVTLETRDAAGAEPQLLANISGTYNGQPIEGRFIGGSALTLRDPAHPYPVDLKLANGHTHMSAVGTLLKPLGLGDADVTLELDGDDLADLYALTTIPLPRTAKYKLRGALDYDHGSVRFRRFSGTVGESDLEGDLALTPGRGRRREVNATVTSKKIVLADLGGFIGATPGHAESSTQTPKTRAEHAQSAAQDKLLPDKPLSLPKLRSADVHVHFTGEHIEGQKMPLDKMVAQLDIVDGRIGLKPLSFQVGKGQILINLALDAQQDLINAAGDIDFRQIDLAQIMGRMTAFKGGGLVAGKARLESTGNSVASLLGHGDGEMQLFTAGGNLSALLVDLAGLDFGGALMSALGLPSKAQLRCAVADYELKKGVLGTRMLLLDTTEANVTGEGNIDLAHEVIDYKIKTESKHPSVLVLHGPVDITGSLRNPKIRPDIPGMAKRAVPAAILGLLLTPLAALLPTINLGLGEDNDCAKLVAETRANAAQTGKEGKAEEKKRSAPVPAPAPAQPAPTR